MLLATRRSAPIKMLDERLDAITSNKISAIAKQSPRNIILIYRVGGIVAE